MTQAGVDLTEDEVRVRLGSYSDANITDELYEFGRMLLQNSVDRIGKLDSKGAALAAYCGGLITVLVATRDVWSKLSPQQVLLTGVATALIFLAAASAIASMSLRKTEWFTQNEWLKGDCLSSADRLRRYHVLTMWGIVKSHHGAYRKKIFCVYLAQFFLIGAGVTLLVALL